MKSKKKMLNKRIIKVTWTSKIILFQIRKQIKKIMKIIIIKFIKNLNANHHLFLDNSKAINSLLMTSLKLSIKIQK